MKIIPQRNQIVGRFVDVGRTASGLVLPESQMRGVTKFVLIDSVGADVKAYKVGDIVIPHHTNQFFLRGGFHRVIFEDKEILAVATELSIDELTIDGKPMTEEAPSS